jgi:predicted nucleic acid-binding protein
VLADTGPLVAILDESDSHHERCTETLRHIQPPLLSCWPVLTEAAWLLRRERTAISKLLAGVEAGLLRILDVSGSELTAIDKLFVRYRDLTPQLADLTLVYLAQREDLETIFTLDRRDFPVFRRKGKSGFHLLPDG